MEKNSLAQPENGRAERSEALAAAFLADLMEDYRVEGAKSIGFLRQVKPATYYWVIVALQEKFANKKLPRSTSAEEQLAAASDATQPNQAAAAPTDPRNDPYRVLKRSIKMEKLRETMHAAEQELARLAAEEEKETREAEEKIDASLAAGVAARAASVAAKSKAADADTGAPA